MKFIFQYAATILINLVVQLIFKLFISSADTIREYAKVTVEEAWKMEQQEPGSMDDIQEAVSSYCNTDSQ